MRYRQVLRLLCCACVFFFSASAYGQDDALPDQIDRANMAQTAAALERLAQGGNAEKAVEGYVGLGQIDMANGNWDGAAENAKKAVGMIPALPKKSGWIVVVHWLNAMTANRRGDADAARASLRAAKAAVESGAETHLAWSGVIEHNLSLLTDDNARARKASEAAIEAFSETKNHVGLGVAAMRLGDLEYDRDKKRRAYNEYDNALRAFRRGGDAHKLIVEAQIHIAEKLIADGEFKAAASRLAIAESELAAIGNIPELADKLSETRSKIPQR